jgi:hypothetical protein
MLRIKILNRKYHPFTNKIKVYGISIEAILIASFILMVLFVMAVYIKRPPGNKQPAPATKLRRL